VRDGQAVRFPYQAGQADEPAVRTVEPWGLLVWHGHWYLIGHDRDRAAPRVFRLSRIAGPVRAHGAPGSVHRPDGVDLRGLLENAVAAPVAGTATVRVRRSAGGELRRMADRITEAPTGAGGSGDGSGWDELTVPYTDLRALAEEVAALGPHAVAVAPAELRERVVALLRGVVG